MTNVIEHIMYWYASGKHDQIWQENERQETYRKVEKFGSPLGAISRKAPIFVGDMREASRDQIAREPQRPERDERQDEQRLEIEGRARANEVVHGQTGGLERPVRVVEAERVEEETGDEYDRRRG